jgi:hypothetical protein
MTLRGGRLVNPACPPLREETLENDLFFATIVR